VRPTRPHTNACHGVPNSNRHAKARELGLVGGATTSPPGHLQPLPTEALGKGLRVFRLGEAEHREVAAIAARRVRERRRR
jgi:hypothetical protein